ncbi:MAG: type I secretion system permease/ATPase [Rhizobiales bacterium]|nr:type I secretion system permease/ATPase [Hyphomicrobiales bacterium]
MLATALHDCRRAFWGVALFSAVVNLLMLAGPIYMLQIYDRVLASRSVSTLVALTIFLVGAYAFQGILDLIRSRIVGRAAAMLDHHLGDTVHRTVIALGARGVNAAQAHQPVRDLDTIRTFMTGAGPIAIVDMPWIPFFLAICFLIHPWIGILALAGAIILIALTIMTERASRSFAKALNESGGLRSAMAEADRRNVASVVSMGMTGTLATRWAKVNERHVDQVGRSSDIVNSYGSITKVLRMLMQSAILGLGAYLVIRQEMTAGAMIAASIMMGRALAPIEVAIGNWRGFVAARDSIKRLSATLAKLPLDREVTDLPKPVKDLSIEGVTVAAPGGTKAILTNVNFRLAAGEVLGVIGPNGSGKSSLSRVILGIWPPARGTARLDGAALDQWDPDVLGRHLGYMSQMVELFPGTVAENIARMTPEPDSAAVLRAAQAAGAHDMILRLPNGYDTMIGDGGDGLSIGQQQRIAIARALYGDPFLVLLDEPSASLDGEGEAALQNAIKQLKLRRAIVIVVVHRRSALAQCDKVLVLLNGQQREFGPRDDVLRRMSAPVAAPAGAANLKVVGELQREDR